MSRPRLHRPLLVAGICAAVGAAGGIAGVAAAPSHKARQAQGPAREHGGFRHGPFGGPAVHATAVVLNRAGDGFVTVTSDRGKVKSLSGDQLTLTEGVRNVTYKDVTLTIPSDAAVMRNFAAAKLSDLKTGDFVRVASSSEGTDVFAFDPSLRPGGPRGGRFHRPPPGAPGPPGPGPGPGPGAWQ